METTLYAPSAPTHSFQIRLSFQPFVAYLKTQQQTDPRNGGVFGLYSYLIDQFEQLPAGLDYPEDVLGAGRLTELFQLASVAVLPLTAAGQNIPYAFGLPMPLTLFYQSDAFAQLTRQSPDLLSELSEQVCRDDKVRYIYKLILKKYYGVDTGTKAMPSFRFQKEINGLTKYFRIDPNTSFIEPHLETTLPPLQPAWIDFVNGSEPVPDGPDQLPIADFSFEGFSFFQLEDVTESETIQQLQEVFAHLQSDTEASIYCRFETALRNLCGQPDLQISLTPVTRVNGQIVHHPDTKSRSIYLRRSEINLDDPQELLDQQTMTAELMQEPTPHLFPGLQGLPDRERQMLHQQGFQSFLVYPITTANETLGILEMGSPQADAFNEHVLGTLDRILPLIQELLRYQLHQFTDNLERLIKKQFTSLQPSVEWKFYEAAWDAVRRGQKPSGKGGATRVSFPQVYPLYGAVDIRNSSVERHKAGQQDLADQLAALEALFAHPDFPSDWARADQLREESYGCQHQLLAGLGPEDEQAMAVFLEQGRICRFVQNTSLAANVPRLCAGYSCSQCVQ